jgi:hypothetical protein
MPKALVNLVVFMLLPGLVGAPRTPLIPSASRAGAADGRPSVEIEVRVEALMPALASSRIPFNHAKSRVLNALKEFKDWQSHGFDWIPQDELAHSVGATTCLTTGELLSLAFFATKGSGESRPSSHAERQVLLLLRKFLSDPDYHNEYAEKLKEVLDKQCPVDFPLQTEPASRLLMRVLPRVRVPPAKAIAILEKGKGKGAVTKLPLRLEELKGIVNSTAERTFALFRRGSERFLLVYPGSPGQLEYGPLMSSPMAQGAAFLAFADGFGHSHPRFMSAEPSRGDLAHQDLVSHARRDTFILALVDGETIEVTLWRANERDYRTERGPDAHKFLVYLGLLAPERPKTRSSLRRLSCIGLLFALGTLMVHLNLLARSMGLMLHLSGEGFGTARSQPKLLSSAA